MTDGRQLEEVVADTDGVDDVDGEERHPTEKEHRCKKKQDRYKQRGFWCLSIARKLFGTNLPVKIERLLIG